MATASRHAELLKQLSAWPGPVRSIAGMDLAVDCHRAGPSILDEDGDVLKGISLE